MCAFEWSFGVKQSVVETLLVSMTEAGYLYDYRIIWGSR